MLRNFTLYNTQTRAAEQFKPLEEGKVGLYVCGITPYELSHIGHARCAVVYDTFVKFLRSTGWEVKFVQNFTDIDDKIINRSKETGEEPLALAERNIKAYKEDMQKLNVMTPDVEPRVSTHIKEIIEFVKGLEKKGFTYIHPNGDVMYDTSKFANYGCLSQRDLDEQIDGIRISDKGKKDPKDFVLWKMAKESENISWKSPWGEGRPGWHIECSAMAEKHLGSQFDIHGGGLDLVFPHHENEVAQSDAFNGCKTVNTWMHTALIKVDNEKMSKSLGNFFLIRDVLNEFSGETIRLFLLGTNYNKSLNFSKEALEQADKGLQRLKNTFKRIENVKFGRFVDDKINVFYDSLAKDLNTPGAVAALFDTSKEINAKLDANENVEDLKTTMLHMAKILGILQHSEEKELAISEIEINSLIEDRDKAKENKDWSLADKIRDDLKSKGIILKDGNNGTTWESE